MNMGILVIALAVLPSVPGLAEGKTENIAADDVWKATLAVVAEEFTLESVQS
jgi:hypothetical protein